MKKRLVYLSICLLLAFSLGACDSEEPKNENNKGAEEQQVSPNENNEVADEKQNSTELNTKVLSDLGKDVDYIVKAHPELTGDDQSSHYMLHSSEVTFGKEIGYFFDVSSDTEYVFYENINDLPKGTLCNELMGKIEDFVVDCPDEIDRNEFLNRINATNVEFYKDGEEGEYSQLYLNFEAGGYNWSIDGIHFNNNPTHFETIYKTDIIKVSLNDV